MAEQCPQPYLDCKYAGTEQCLITKHHRIWPKFAYRSLIEKYFRELDENTEMLPRCDHDELHATTKPPKKPSRDEMLKAIDRSKNA